MLFILKLVLLWYKKRSCSKLIHEVRQWTNLEIICLQFQPVCGLWQHSILLKKKSIRNPAALVWIHLAEWKKWTVFSFSLFLLFSLLHVYFSVLSVLSLPTLLNTVIVCRFSTINYQILTQMGSGDRSNLQTNLLFQASASRQGCINRVPLLFLAFFLHRSYAAVLSILLINYSMSLSLRGWRRHIGVTLPLPSETVLSRKLHW